MLNLVTDTDFMYENLWARLLSYQLIIVTSL